MIHLLAALPAGREIFDVPLGHTLRATWVGTRSADGHTTSLDVACTDPRLRLTFLSLIGEMLDRADETGRPCIDELTGVLDSWRSALARAKRELDRSRAVGLFGELTILEQLARKDQVRALAAWRGREGHRHDFARTNALEVKTFSSTGSPSVQIHGLLQLDPPPAGVLHLVAFRVVETDSGSSLAELVERIVEQGVSRADIADCLGEDAPALEGGRDRRFTIEETRLHEVGEDFPGLRASRLDETALRGVDDLTYSLNLDACPGGIDPRQLDRILEEL
ncbi:PD-(D/E)XK motif protein [Brachybacterium phenoliresistens]|nr:PD-(D/E)XK motif protein [Brachybacterium phenoliresistens]